MCTAASCSPAAMDATPAQRLASCLDALPSAVLARPVQANNTGAELRPLKDMVGYSQVCAVTDTLLSKLSEAKPR